MLKAGPTRECKVFHQFAKNMEQNSWGAGEQNSIIIGLNISFFLNFKPKFLQWFLSKTVLKIYQYDLKMW
jgi:hypothetical protein